MFIRSLYTYIHNIFWICVLVFLAILSTMFCKYMHVLIYNIVKHSAYKNYEPVMYSTLYNLYGNYFFIYDQYSLRCIVIVPFWPSSLSLMSLWRRLLLAGANVVKEALPVRPKTLTVFTVIHETKQKSVKIRSCVSSVLWCRFFWTHFNLYSITVH